MEAAAGVAAGRRHLRLLPTPRLRVADVAIFYGERSGGIRTYLDAKAAYARATGAFEHHLIVPGRRERHGDGVHELRGVPVAAANGYRWPATAGPLLSTLQAIKPDVVLLHDPFWRPHEVTRAARALGAIVVMVHHGSVDLDSHAIPGSTRLYRRAFQAWLHHAYEPADAVMAACDPFADTGRAAGLRLRFGLDPAFRPQPDVRRGDHVLYVGRLAREKGIFELLEAAALAREPWPLRLLGAGTATRAVAARVRRLGLTDRVSFRPYEADPDALARAYAGARCVVMPGSMETFGLVAFEAAACGASAVACRTAPSTRRLGGLVHTFPPEDPRGLLAAIERARAAAPDRAAAARFAAEHSWSRAFEAELIDLQELLWCR
jgi:glycosyltransferase involved in cell wall biosynthesis